MNVKEFGDYINLLREGRGDEAEQLRKRDIPNKLIKYVWLDDSDSDEKKFFSLENNMLWLSTVMKLNDPYEFKGMIVNEEAFTKAGYPNSVIDGYRKLLKMEEYGVVCLSAREMDYLPMWAYYTNNFRGYCIEYEAFNKDCLHQVMYVPDRVQICSLFFQLKEAVKNAIAQGKERTPETDWILTVIRENLFLKSISWEHEKEYRVAAPISDKIGENYPISNFGLKVKRIITGINCSDSNILRLNRISNKIGCGNIFISSISEREYGMKVERLMDRA